MILLDTHVLSETMRPEPDPAVLRWLDAQVAETLYISTVTVAEMLFGVGALPDGRRKQALASTLRRQFTFFDGRILAFDLDAARHHADLAIAARAAGRGFPTLDGYIAAIAAARVFDVATRDGSAFEAAGLPTIDPWQAGLKA